MPKKVCKKLAAKASTYGRGNYRCGLFYRRGCYFLLAAKTEQKHSHTRGLIKDSQLDSQFLMTSTVQGVPGGKTHWIKKKIAPSIKPRGRPSASAQTLDQTKKTSIDPKVTSNVEIGTDSTTAATATDSVPTTGSTATSVIQPVVSDTPQIQDSTQDRITAVECVSECVSVTNDTSPVPNTRTTAITDSPLILNSPPLDTDTVLLEEINKGRRRVRTISSSSHKSDQDVVSYVHLN